MKGKNEILVIDERDMSISWDTPQKVKKWSGLKVPKWCDEIRFNNERLSMLALNNKDAGKNITYKNTFGSWGNSVVCE